MKTFFNQKMQLESGLSNPEANSAFAEHPVFLVFSHELSGGAIFLDAETLEAFWYTTPVQEFVTVSDAYGYIQTRNTKYHLCPVR